MKLREIHAEAGYLKVLFPECKRTRTCVLGVASISDVKVAAARKIVVRLNSDARLAFEEVRRISEGKRSGANHAVSQSWFVFESSTEAHPPPSGNHVTLKRNAQQPE